MPFSRFRLALLAIPALFAAGCASTPDSAPYDSLLASTPLYERMRPETGEVVEVARFSQLPPDGVPERWEPWLPLPSNSRTRYSVARLDGHTCMEADATNGNSALRRVRRISPQRHPVVEWSWRWPPSRPGRDARAGSRPTPPARPRPALHRGAGKVPFVERRPGRL